MIGDNNVEISVVLDYRLFEIKATRANGEVVWKTGWTPAGCELVWAVLEHLQTEHNLLIGRLTTERVILNLGSAVPPTDPQQEMVVRGRNLKNGEPEAITLTDAEISTCIASIIDIAIWTVLGSLRPRNLSDYLSGTSDEKRLYPTNYLPLEFLSQLEAHPVVLTGIFSRIRQLDQRLHEVTDLAFVHEQAR